MSDSGSNTGEADLGLIAAALGGDAGSVSALVARLTPVIQARVARTLLRQSRGDVRRDVEDYTQDVLMSLFAEDGKALRRWAPDRGLSLENFVGLVAERLAISRLRSGKHNPWREDTLAEDELLGAEEAVDEALPGGVDDPARILDSADALRTLLDRLQASLSPLGFRLFELLYVRERSVDDVQRICGLSRDAVYAWRSRLRKAAAVEFGALMSDAAESGRIPGGR